MSKTLFVDYRGDGFWAYDVVAGLFLKHLIDRACLYVERQPCEWLIHCIANWRVIAVVSDYGLPLDAGWTEEQRQVILGLVDEACLELASTRAISEVEASSWSILDGQGIFFRGHAQIPTTPVIEFGKAITLLIKGVSPPAPSGSWWFYGIENTPTTIKKKI